MKTFVAKFVYNDGVSNFVNAFYTNNIRMHCDVIIVREKDTDLYRITIQVEEKYATWAEQNNEKCIVRILNSLGMQSGLNQQFVEIVGATENDKIQGEGA